MKFEYRFERQDFINYLNKEWLTPELLKYVVNNFKFLEIFSNFSEHNYKFGNVLTQNLWIQAFQRNNEVARYIPSHYMTNEMIEALANLKNVTFEHNIIIKSQLTPELFEKVYFNCDTVHKLRLFSSGPSVTRLISKEVAEDILSIDIRKIIL